MDAAGLEFAVIAQDNIAVALPHDALPHQTFPVFAGGWTVVVADAGGAEKCLGEAELFHGIVKFHGAGELVVIIYIAAHQENVGAIRYVSKRIHNSQGGGHNRQGRVVGQILGQLTDRTSAVAEDDAVVLDKV